MTDIAVMVQLYQSEIEAHVPDLAEGIVTPEGDYDAKELADAIYDHACDYIHDREFAKGTDADSIRSAAAAISRNIAG